jgi:hypothetical protein
MRKGHTKMNNDLTLAQLFGTYARHKDVTTAITENATRLVIAVNTLKHFLETSGVKFEINPGTRSIVSGLTNGGFRPQSCKIGAPNSAHMEGLAVDIYDPSNQIDAWLWQNAKAFDLAPYGLYFERQEETEHWSHWGLRAPMSGRRFFFP